LYRLTRRTLAFTCLLCLILSPTGCRKRQAVVADLPFKPKPKPEISEIDLKSYKPNEAGSIMILMYHNFDPVKPNNDLNRTPDQFRQDLEDLYKRNYRPITVSELVDFKIEVPAGKSPVVLTFDDALPTQFKIVTGKDGQAHIDQDCAVGIMEKFSKAHPDWPTKGTFFVLPKEGRGRDPFAQTNTVADKFDYLLSHGYEVANHTSTHPDLNKLSADKIKWELATALKDIKAIAPKATMDVLALPYGVVPRKHMDLLKSGDYGGTHYENKAVLRAAWRPVLSPITSQSSKNTAQDHCVYNPFALERIKPDPTQAKLAGTLEYWLKYFDENPTVRFISDGNPVVAAVPKSLKSIVDPARVKKYGVTLQLYGFGGGKSGTGSGLSVE